MTKHMLKVALTFFIFTVSCSSGFLKYDKTKDFFSNKDFEEKVKIKEVEPQTESSSDLSATQTSISNKLTQVDLTSQASSANNLLQPTESKGLLINTPEILKKQEEILKTKTPVSAQKKSNKKNKSSTKKTETPDVEPIKVQREPLLEDPVGFENGERRPQLDPFRVGEKVIHSVSYFAARAGTLTFGVGPYVEVNNQKSYSFRTEIKSSPLFSSFYSVEDVVDTFLDYESLVPHVFKLKIKESSQIKEAQSFFDHKALRASYWEHKYTEKNGHEEKKMDWDLLPFSQNAFSAIFYMRVFKWQVGKEYSFRVSDDEKNIVFKAKAIERVQLNTDAGTFDAIKAKAEVVSRGALAQTGDMYFWISNDEHKYVLRIEAKIKIGTLVSEVIQIIPGKSQ